MEKKKKKLQRHLKIVLKVILIVLIRLKIVMLIRKQSWIINCQLRSFFAVSDDFEILIVRFITFTTIVQLTE